MKFPINNVLWALNPLRPLTDGSYSFMKKAAKGTFASIDSMKYLRVIIVILKMLLPYICVIRKA